MDAFQHVLDMIGNFFTGKAVDLQADLNHQSAIGKGLNSNLIPLPQTQNTDQDETSNTSNKKMLSNRPVSGIHPIM